MLLRREGDGENRRRLENSFIYNAYHSQQNKSGHTHTFREDEKHLMMKSSPGNDCPLKVWLLIQHHCLDISDGLQPTKADYSLRCLLFSLNDWRIAASVFSLPTSRSAAFNGNLLSWI